MISRLCSAKERRGLQSRFRQVAGRSLTKQGGERIGDLRLVEQTECVPGDQAVVCLEILNAQHLCRGDAGLLQDLHPVARATLPGPFGRRRLQHR